MMNANEREKDAMRLRSFECKVTSEEGIHQQVESSLKWYLFVNSPLRTGEGTVFLKIGAEKMGNTEALKTVNIIENYEPVNPPNGHSIEVEYQNPHAHDSESHTPNMEVLSTNFEHQNVSSLDLVDQVPT
jgi:hypothetical protein